MTQLQATKDPIMEHRLNCPLCQKLEFCQVSHDMLLKEAGYIPKKKEEKKQ